MNPPWVYTCSPRLFFFKYFYFYLFVAVLGLRCCVGFPLVVLSWGYSLVGVHRLLIAVAFLVAEQAHALGRVGFSSCGIPKTQIQLSGRSTLGAGPNILLGMALSKLEYKNCQHINTASSN